MWYKETSEISLQNLTDVDNQEKFHCVVVSMRKPDTYYESLDLFSIPGSGDDDVPTIDRDFHLSVIFSSDYYHISA